MICSFIIHTVQLGKALVQTPTSTREESSPLTAPTTALSHKASISGSSISTISTGETGERGEASTPTDFDLARFVANEIGATDNKIFTGSADEPVEYDLSELTPKQQVAILKDYYSKSRGDEAPTQEFTPDEMFVIDSLREGKLEDLYNQLSEELGRPPVTNTSNDISEDQMIEWKIKTELPELTADELEYEIENFKASPLYEKRLESAKNQYNQALDYQEQQITQQQQQQQEQQLDQLRNQITEIAQNTGDLFDFELNDDIKNNALADLLEPDAETGNPQMIDFLGTPEGLAQTAMLWRAMPEINEYVNSLHQEIEKLKAAPEKGSNNKTVISTNDDNMYEEEFETIPELKVI